VPGATGRGAQPRRRKGWRGLEAGPARGAGLAALEANRPRTAHAERGRPPTAQTSDLRAAGIEGGHIATPRCVSDDPRRMASQPGHDDLERLIGAGVPPDGLVFYGRWFQFETWLREVAYVELRAKYGRAWTDRLAGRAPKRAERDVRNSYMASADAEDVLAYADVSDLFGLIAAHWPLYEPFLLPLGRWTGRTDELRELRNRNAHCRRPHRDDVARVEQTLRDLESGASWFYRSYLNTYDIEPSADDPLVRAWVGGQHQVASRLLRHAERQYDVRFRLRASVRPWAEAPTQGDVLSGREGVLWHAEWILGDWEVSPMALWQDVSGRLGVGDLVIHLLFNTSTITATFSACDAHDEIADAIGMLFDGVLREGTRRHGASSLEEAVDEHAVARAEVARLPARVQIDSPLTMIDPLLPEHVSIFGA
jgi:hypothetical protein